MVGSITLLSLHTIALPSFLAEPNDLTAVPQQSYRPKSLWPSSSNVTEVLDPNSEAVCVVAQTVRVES